MICTHCKKQFDQKLNIPRLLIVCGHSLCQNCCYRLHSNNRVECPECHSSTFIDSISLLPKNLALISLQPHHQLCAKHHKKYEAFCEKENQLICIECILQDGHKNHQMDSIHNSFQKNKQKWSKKIQKLQKHSQNTNEILANNKKNQQDFKESYNKTKETVAILFKQIRQIIDKQQENIQTKFRQTFTHTDSKFQQKIISITDNLTKITNSLLNFKEYENYNEINFLETYNSREIIYSQISQQIQQNLKAPILNYSKKIIIDSFTKAIQGLLVQKLEKSQKKVSAICINNYNSANINQPRKISDSASTIKAVRKPPAVQNNSSQNTSNPQNANMNRKKVSSKKDITSTVIVPTGGSVLVNKTNVVKQRIELNCNGLARQIRSDLSAVDPKQSLCHSFMSNMTYFLSDRKFIYLIGGFNEQANNIIKLNLFTLTWQEVCPLISNRSKFGSIAVDKQIFVFGGKKGKERVSDSQIYHIGTNKWTKLTPMCKNRSGFAVVNVGQLLYFIGGNDGDNILNTVETFNTQTGQWKKRDSMNENRDQLAVIVGKNSKIYAIGGFGGKDNQPLRSVQVYDPKTQKWKFIPPMKQSRRALAAAVLADGIYAIGGFDGSMYMNSVEKYQEGDKEWTTVAAMKQARCTHSAVSLSESQQIYVFGGFDYVPLDSVQRYNVITNQWEAICRMPTPRFMHASLLMKDE